MLGFWIAAAIVSAATGAGVLLFARRAQALAATGAPDPALAIYERQLLEVDELAGRGLLAPKEHEGARTEVARRLLHAARGSRRGAERRGKALWAAPLAAAGAPLLAMALYLAVGRPDLPDQAFRDRVARWRAAPERLGAPEAAAVLETVVRERPEDAQAYGLLGRARLAAGDRFGAVRALETAARLEPGRAARWTDLSRALLNLEPPDVAGARRALARALALDSVDVDARYWAGRADVADGRPAEAAAKWRALAAALPAGDPRRAALEQDIAAIDDPPAAAADPAVAAMVEGLASRLRDRPDDPPGWARLARAYAVLGREAELQAALAQARRLFADRPQVLAAVEAEAEAGRRVQRAR